MPRDWLSPKTCPGTQFCSDNPVRLLFVHNSWVKQRNRASELPGWALRGGSTHGNSLAGLFLPLTLPLYGSLLLKVLITWCFCLIFETLVRTVLSLEWNFMQAAVCLSFVRFCSTLPHSTSSPAGTDASLPGLILFILLKFPVCSDGVGDFVTAFPPYLRPVCFAQSGIIGRLDVSWGFFCTLFGGGTCWGCVHSSLKTLSSVLISENLFHLVHSIPTSLDSFPIKRVARSSPSPVSPVSPSFVAICIHCNQKAEKIRITL